MTQLSKIQKTSIERPIPETLNFLTWLSERSSGEYMSLFSGTGQAAEKEHIVRQTICQMVANWRSYGNLTSLINLKPDGGAGLAENSTAFRWLVENKYICVVDGGDFCAVTQLTIAKLYIHFSDELPVQRLLGEQEP
jgi:hypothetical protein